MIMMGPRIYPSFMTMYANPIVPEPSVAAISEKTEPETPPALNYL
jgi:hypothetical protein